MACDASDLMPARYAPVPHSADMVNQKSNVPPPSSAASVSIAAQRRGASWRVPCWNGACTGRELWATWIDQPRRTIKNHGAGEWRGSRMSVGRSLFAATLAGALALAVSPALIQTLRYANQGELKSLDPYT